MRVTQITFVLNSAFDFGKIIGYIIVLVYTANAYRQTTDKLMFKSVISTVR